jgi:outer membrane receptor protein involved in Fe transport
MKATVQELRLSSSGEGPLQWQLGGYYANQDGRVDQDTYLVDLATKTILFTSPFAPLDTGGFYNSQSYREYAAFANLNYQISPTVDLSVGGRYSDNSQEFRENGFGLLGGGIVLDHPSSEGVLTYSADARWRPAPDLMVYGRFATGFVPGGGNNVPVLAPPSLPRSYDSSTTTNLEAGFKGRILDGRMTLELSAFDIEWKDIQIAASFGGVSTTLNGGTARSSGVEWNVGATPLTGLSLNFNGAYTRARLTEDLPASVNGLDGDRLPGSPLWSTSFSANYEHPLTAALTGFVGMDWRYAGKREGEFTATGPRQQMPAYDILDLRAGIAAQHWKLTGFVRNVSDELAISSVSSSTLAGEFGPQMANIYQPRTYGLTVSADF